MSIEAKFFKDQDDFRKWLAENHATATEIIVGFYKLGTGKSTMTWSQSVDQAICFGWIDGITRKIDDESYCIRFTPRKSTSIWSAINIKKVEDLTARNLMHRAGLEAYAKRKEHRSKIYAYESVPSELSPEFEKQFKANKAAWEFFTSQAPYYQRVVIHSIMTAKQEKTRISRLEKAISFSELKKRV